ncbi:MAG TPA: ABC transporter ATP-binding protein [Anaerolineae bacterium]|nr:ABC transporter ATP-binding protein [Anaerolineae bacterium]
MTEMAIWTEQLSKQFALPRGLRTLLQHGARRHSQDPDRIVTAVDGVSLNIQPGELYGLLGPNGAGKTTLIRLLCTMVVPTSGQGSIFGIDLSHSNQIRQMIGMTSGDERSFYWRLSGRHNLEFFGVLYGLSEQQAHRRAIELLERVDLASHADRPFRTYSSGQKQRLGIARALLHHPRLLFLDEPTRSLDPTATLRLHEFIEKDLLRDEGVTILLTTHRLDEAERLSQRIGIMQGGRLQAEGTPDELRARLGPTVNYRLHVAHLTLEPDSLAAGLPAVLRAQPNGVAGGWTLEMEAVDSEAALAELLQRIVTAGGQVRDVQREQPSLEQVFQRFTQTQ